MKFAILALVCFVSTFVAAELEQELIDWNHIKPLDIHVEPIGPAPVPSPGHRIAGGTTAPRNGFPYMAALIINNSGFCGGSIVSPNFVLTAAHCLDVGRDASVQVILGAHNPRIRINEPTQVILSAAAYTIHYWWDPSTMQADLAVVRLASIPLGPGISIIRMTGANSPRLEGTIATIAGWGRTSDSSTALATELQTANLTVITNDECAQSYGSLIVRQHVCTSGQGSRGACVGDSGGPLVLNGVQVGVSSFGSHSCQAGFPSVYARISIFRQWIFANVGR